MMATCCLSSKFKYLEAIAMPNAAGNRSAGWLTPKVSNSAFCFWKTRDTSVKRFVWNCSLRPVKFYVRMLDGLTSHKQPDHTVHWTHDERQPSVQLTPKLAPKYTIDRNIVNNKMSKLIAKLQPTARSSPSCPQTSWSWQVKFTGVINMVFEGAKLSI